MTSGIRPPRLGTRRDSHARRGPSAALGKGRVAGPAGSHAPEPDAKGVADALSFLTDRFEGVPAQADR